VKQKGAELVTVVLTQADISRLIGLMKWTITTV